MLHSLDIIAIVGQIGTPLQPLESSPTKEGVASPPEVTPPESGPFRGRSSAPTRYAGKLSQPREWVRGAPLGQAVTPPSASDQHASHQDRSQRAARAASWLSER